MFRRYFLVFSFICIFISCTTAPITGRSQLILLSEYQELSLGSSAYSQAIKEAKRIGDINVIASSEDKNFSYIPKDYSSSEDTDYLHFTSNNTIFGTQFHEFPKVSKDTMLVCDMSSDILSKKIDVSKFDLIYAGAQKNMGPAGTTLVIIKDEILNKTGREIPTMLDYSTHISKGSMFNTPPVFPIYVSMLTLEWLKNNGGVDNIEKLNNAKAQLLYSEIDRNRLFKGVAAVEDRSKMNVTFVLTDESKQETFDKLWNDAGINGLKGHRSVGGYRASIYNALPIESVQVLVNTMQELENTL